MVHPPYTRAARILWTAISHWPQIDGIAASQGVVPLDLTPSRFLNYVWAWMLERVTDMDEFLTELDKPWANMPKEKAKTVAATPENLSSWSSMIGSTPGG